MFYQITCSALQEAAYFINPAIIFLQGYPAYTATFTATYMKLKAGTELFSQNGFACNLQAAGTQRIKLAEELQKGSGVHYAAVWPEVPAAVLLKRTGQENARILFCRHAYPGISL